MMPLSEIFLIAIVLYLLYGFVFNFVVPVWKTTRKVKQQFRNMQENSQGQSGSFYQQSGPFQQQSGPFRNTAGQNSNGAGPNSQQAQKKAGPSDQLGEYIDFEEIKPK